MSEYGDAQENTGTNPSTERHFGDVVNARLSRRGVLLGGMATVIGFMSPALVASPAAAAPRAKAGAAPKGAAGLLGFTAIGNSPARDIAVAPGYTARPFLPWGTPILGSYPPFRPGAVTEEDQSQQVGMHHDGMHYFPVDGSRRGLLVFNHEYTDEQLLHRGDRATPRPSSTEITLEQVRASQAAHGVSVVEIAQREPGRWEVVRSPRNRRITARTPMRFSGPAAGHRLLRTPRDSQGTSPVGTVNNCAHGYTPWGTYLTCEENFNGYFKVVGPFSAEQTGSNRRYGVGTDNYYWGERDDRFALTTENANEVNRFGWVVEIDPMDPQSTPVKRTALGRVKHEGAFVHVTKGQRVVVYMGDDQVNEYAYKFVSSDNWKSLRARGVSPLDSGTLYVARFGEAGRGEWLPLVHGQLGLTAANGFADQGDVLVKARLAATQVGATPMHRPEWTSVDPGTGAVYLTLSNDGGSAAAVRNAANPRTPNQYGSVIRWFEDGDDHAATGFQWELFVLAGAGRGSGDGSTVSSEDAFGSPDGLWVDRDSRVWIQTDGDQPGGGNDQMLAANPFVRDAAGTPEIKRFFTGVLGCEVTGVIDTPDQRTMFVNIQHPGDGTGGRNRDGSAQPPLVTWPYDDDVDLPRSATVVITKDDGGVIGT